MTAHSVFKPFARSLILQGINYFSSTHHVPSPLCWVLRAVTRLTRGQRRPCCTADSLRGEHTSDKASQAIPGRNDSFYGQDVSGTCTGGRGGLTSLDILVSPSDRCGSFKAPRRALVIPPRPVLSPGLAPCFPSRLFSQTLSHPCILFSRHLYSTSARSL